MASSFVVLHVDRTWTFARMFDELRRRNTPDPIVEAFRVSLAGKSADELVLAGVSDQDLEAQYTAHLAAGTTFEVVRDGARLVGVELVPLNQVFEA